MQLTALVSGLDAFEPADDESETLGVLYELLHGFEALPKGGEAMPALYGLLERFPDAELGAPGPIVHALESLPGYDDGLAASVQRRPVPLTVWMINRILNVTDPGVERHRWLAELRAAGEHPLSSPAVREDVRFFLAHQGAVPE